MFRTKEKQTREPLRRASWHIRITMMIDVILSAVMCLVALVCIAMSAWLASYSDAIMNGETDFSSSTALSAIDFSSTLVQALVLVSVVAAIAAAWCVTFCVLSIRKRWDRKKFTIFVTVGLLPVFILGFILMMANYLGAGSPLCTCYFFAAMMTVIGRREGEEEIAEAGEEEGKETGKEA